jgi:hypothetical protein
MDVTKKSFTFRDRISRTFRRKTFHIQVLLDFFFGPENEGDMFLHPKDPMALYSRR